LAVLQIMADDSVSLCSAARAHSRLRQAAAVAFSSISWQVKNQQLADTSLLPYLSKHGQHVGHMSLSGAVSFPPRDTVRLRQLPSVSKLTSLYCSNLELQLLSRDAFSDVLGSSRPPLK
jgi:hypothetical protein